MSSNVEMQGPENADASTPAFSGPWFVRITAFSQSEIYVPTAYEFLGPGRVELLLPSIEAPSKTMGRMWVHAVRVDIHLDAVWSRDGFLTALTAKLRELDRLHQKIRRALHGIGERPLLKIELAKIQGVENG